MTIIHKYTREDAIRDGVLVDVTDTAKEAGIKFATAVTQTVWRRCVEVPDEAYWQDETGRLWDILWMFSIQAAKKDTDTLQFVLYVQNDATEAKLVRLKAVVGPGDDAEPVITIMLPGED